MKFQVKEDTGWRDVDVPHMSTVHGMQVDWKNPQTGQTETVTYPWHKVRQKQQTTRTYEGE